jgi:hypothetical protein
VLGHGNDDWERTLLFACNGHLAVVSERPAMRGQRVRGGGQPRRAALPVVQSRQALLPTAQPSSSLRGLFLRWLILRDRERVLRQ